MTITKKTTTEELYKIIENIVHQDLPTRDKFSFDVINFINSNNQYYWFLLNVNNSLDLLFCLMNLALCAMLTPPLCK